MRLYDAYRKAGFQSSQLFSDATGIPHDTIKYAMKMIPIHPQDADRILTYLQRYHINPGEVELAISGSGIPAAPDKPAPKPTLKQVFTELGYSSQWGFADDLGIAPSSIYLAIHREISPDLAREIVAKIKLKTGRIYSIDDIAWKLTAQHSRRSHTIDELPARPTLREIQSFLDIKSQLEFAQTIGVTYREISKAMQMKPIDPKWQQKIVEGLREKCNLLIPIDQIRWTMEPSTAAI